MRIFSNFDTRLRQKTYAEYKGEYGADNVICFGRSFLYEIYKVIIPFMLIVLFTFLWLTFFYERLNGDYFIYIIVAIVIIDIVFLFPVIGKYLDYKMDFVIVIPNSIIVYDQWGILRKNVVTITALSIKTISIQRSWLLYSIFDNGDIIILTEGDVERNGEVRLKWVPKPEKRRNQIVKIIGLDLKANQNPQV